MREVTSEHGIDTDAPVIGFSETTGKINADLTVGVDVTKAVPLLANDGVCSPGVKLHGAGFIVTPQQAEVLGLGRRPGLDKHIRHYRNGRDLTARARGAMVIDLFDLDAEDVRRRFPEVYQHILTTVKPERDQNNRASYRDRWWVFGEPRRELRPALSDLERYIATVETMQHRVFFMLGQEVLPDNRLVCVASDNAALLGVLCSRFHAVWALATGGTLEDRPIYTKSRCFDPYPFPALAGPGDAAIRVIAEELDAHRKRVLAEHPHLTLTGLYNVLERLRAGVSCDDLDEAEQRIFSDGLVLILKELHDRLDAAVAKAYGWPVDLPDEEILTRLVALNKERAAEERGGLVRWLRPDYQIPRFGSEMEKAKQIEADLVGGAAGVIAEGAKSKPSFPADEMEQTAAVMAVLFDGDGAMDAGGIAASFRQGRRVERKVTAILAALARMGVATSRDGGRTFSSRRTA